jgi:cytochrome c oxidase subunit 1
VRGQARTTSARGGKAAAPLCDYPDAFAGWNYVSSVGVYISWVSTLIFFFGVAHAFFRRRQAEVNPCAPGATALKWTLPSPPPFHAFEELPRISDE